MPARRQHDIIVSTHGTTAVRLATTAAAYLTVIPAPDIAPSMYFFKLIQNTPFGGIWRVQEHNGQDTDNGPVVTGPRAGLYRPNRVYDIAER